jgi:Ca-activated chloride channel homolog
MDRRLCTIPLLAKRGPALEPARRIVFDRITNPVQTPAMKTMRPLLRNATLLLLPLSLIGCSSPGGSSSYSYSGVPVSSPVSTTKAKPRKPQAPSGNYPLAAPMMVSPVPEAPSGNIITRGLRFGRDALTRNAIDSLLSSGGTTANTESYASLPEIPFRQATKEPLSTFSVDVDTASYANVRRLLQSGSTVPPGAVRLEEMINYFSYDYPAPVDGRPFSVNTATASCPWQEDHRLVRVALRGKDIARQDRPASNFVFLIDVSGSMEDSNKLPLVQSSLRLLMEELQPSDRVALAVYAGSEGLVLPSTPVGSGRKAILKAIDKLESGGSTNGGAGINLAYKIARENFLKGGNNRVILATDGDFNVGTTDESSLTALIQKQAKSGVFLSVLGYGMGNLKDSTLEKLADKGNGNYAYIDTLKEARKVLVREMGASLYTIAKDVKIQVEFNPSQVGSWRLLGYENRVLAHEDFDDDTKDAGEIGAGHRVTALYEIIPAGQQKPGSTQPPLKYTTSTPTPAASNNELLTVKLRYQPPAGGASKLITKTVTDDGQTFAQAESEFRFATAVAAFGMKLRGSPNAANINKRNIRQWAAGATGPDPHGDRKEFLSLVKKL